MGKSQDQRRAAGSDCFNCLPPGAVYSGEDPGQSQKKNPPAPYITSTMQQEAYRLLHFPVKKTMSVAQRLYEGLELGELGPVGLITYMRTDSVRISEVARQAAKKYIEEHFGPEYLPAKPVLYKSRKTAQEAHEAIRPAHLDLPPEKV